MKKVWIAIVLSTLFMIVFHISPYVGIPTGMIIGMFLLSPFVVVTMVFIILKYGEPSKYTFDERFYDDWDYKRNMANEEKRQ